MRLGGSVSTRIRARGIPIYHVFPLFFPIFHTLGGCRTACSHADRDRDGNGGCVARDVPRRCALLVLATYSLVLLLLPLLPLLLLLLVA